MRTINGVDENTYSRVHMWLRYNYGPAHKCENNCCKKQSNIYQWSLKKGKCYKKNRNNFQMLCVSCHKFHDIKPDTGKKISKANNGQLHKLTSKDVMRIIESYATYERGTNKRLASELGVTPQHVCWVVRNKNRLLATNKNCLSKL